MDIATKIRMRAGLLLAAGTLVLACEPEDDPLAPRQLSREVPASSAVRTPDVRVGQWVTWLTTAADGHRTSITMRVIAEQDGHHWFELRQVSDGLANITARILGRPASIEEPKGEIAQIEFDPTGDELFDLLASAVAESLASEMMSRMAQAGFEAVHMDPETVRVPAGTFHGCYKSFERMLDGEATVIWRHPSVPFSGMVRAQSEDASIVTELVDYGM